MTGTTWLWDTNRNAYYYLSEAENAYIYQDGTRISRQGVIQTAPKPDEPRSYGQESQYPQSSAAESPASLATRFGGLSVSGAEQRSPGSNPQEGGGRESRKTGSSGQPALSYASQGYAQTGYGTAGAEYGGNTPGEDPGTDDESEEESQPPITPPSGVMSSQPLSRILSFSTALNITTIFGSTVYLRSHLVHNHEESEARLDEIEGTLRAHVGLMEDALERIEKKTSSKEAGQESSKQDGKKS